MTKEEKIRRATEALEALKSRISGGGYHPTDEVKEEYLSYRKETKVSFAIRFWGTWVNPDYAEDEEDYDGDEAEEEEED